jgi:L,D-peptidoglycan transpeptidase YkuD (ErfK/YbiS/YcfS/YnhG family)
MGQLAAPSALGRAGIARNKREGDEHTPAGLMRPVAVLYRPDRIRRPRTLLPASPIGRNDGWCDDPADRNYNRPVHLPFGASHEHLWRADHLYDLVVVLDFNLAHPRPGGGSAIFVHVAAEGFAPTAGCVAVSRRALQALVARMKPDTIIDIR